MLKIQVTFGIHISNLKKKKSKGKRVLIIWEIYEKSVGEMLEKWVNIQKEEKMLI